MTTPKVMHMVRYINLEGMESLCGQSYNPNNLTHEYGKVTCKLCRRHPKFSPPFRYLADDISKALHMGITAEADDFESASVPPGVLTNKQIDWIGAWLAGEGFKR